MQVLYVHIIIHIYKNYFVINIHKTNEFTFLFRNKFTF